MVSQYSNHQHHEQYPPDPPDLGATFVPGGFDDYYLPPAPPELISPVPQRIMPEVPEQIQHGIAHLELDANEPIHRGIQSAGFDDSHPHATNNYDHYQQHGNHHGSNPQNPTYNNNNHRPRDTPSFSPFPPLQNPCPDVPPSDADKEDTLCDARLPVLNSNDPEMQLTWAQDALAYVESATMRDQHLTGPQPPRAATPQAEHQLRVDAMNIVSFLADQHHPKAEFMRGLWLEFGKFGTRLDRREAFRAYQRAAERGYSRAEYRMGTQFEANNDPVKALQHYKRGAEAGDSASNYRLGMMTLLGQAGQVQDYARGLQLLRQAAATADDNAPMGAWVLGMLLAKELPQVQIPEQILPYDEKGAKANIERAAYLGFAKAQLKMGSAYELCTLGCDFNPVLSLHYNALASRRGEIEADMAISKWFLCGYDGVFQKNEELAFEYAQRAALAGLPAAMFALGYFYEIGLHVPVSVEKAMEWYEKAAAVGNTDAQARIHAIKESGTTLSKKDHESMAIDRIKSQYGSRRGKRPPNLAAKAAAASSNLASMAEGDYADDGHGHGAHLTPLRPATTTGSAPRRSSSSTPYPLSDGPPVVGPSVVRPATTAPYPVDDGPRPVGGQGRHSFAGGFAPEFQRPPPRNDAAAGSHGHRFPPGPSPWQQQRPGPNYGPGNGRGGAYAPRMSSGPPSAAYRRSTPSGPQLPPKIPLDQHRHQQQQQQSRPPLRNGYSAAADDARRRMPQQRVNSEGPALQPLAQQQQHRPPSTSASSYSNLGGGGAPDFASARPGAGAASLRPGSAPSSRPPSGSRPPPVAATGGKTAAGAGVGAAAGATSTRPVGGRAPGQGPKTFEEMGVPQQKKDECVSVAAAAAAVGVGW